MSRKNPLKRDLFTKKYKPRVIKAKRAKAVLKEKNNKLITTCWLKN